MKTPLEAIEATVTTTAEGEDEAVHEGVNEGVNVGERDSEVDTVPVMDTDAVLPKLLD